MLTDKNKERLGKLIFDYFEGIDPNKANNFFLIGKSIDRLYNYILKENERDERDLANGKGQL